MKKWKTGFTLIELLVVISLIAILAGVVMVQFQSYTNKARASKALGELSSVLPSMISCWGNAQGVSDTPVTTPSSGGGEQICELSESYGTWPQTSEGTLAGYAYGSAIDNETRKFAVYLTSSEDEKRICCNSTMNNCRILDAVTDPCTSDDPSN